MKYLAVVLLLILCAVNFSSAQPYDTTNFVVWAEAANDSGEICVAFVSKSDTAGDTTYPVYYQKYKDNLMTKNDTILFKWNWNRAFNDVSRAVFSIALDRNGCGHFVSNGDSGTCIYLTDQADSKWKMRYILSYKNVSLNQYRNFGRRNDIAIFKDSLDIVATADIRRGIWPFSVMFRISGPVLGDSLKNTYITKDTVIYSEEIFDLKISNLYGRLIILYGLGQWGGYNANRLLLSKNYPQVSDYFYLQIRSIWGTTVSPVNILKEEESYITVAIGRYPYVFTQNIALTDIGFVGIKYFCQPVFSVAGRNFSFLNGKVFNLLGRTVTSCPDFRLPAGIYLLKTGNGPTNKIKRLQIK